VVCAVKFGAVSLMRMPMSGVSLGFVILISLYEDHLFHLLDRVIAAICRPRAIRARDFTT